MCARRRASPRTPEMVTPPTEHVKRPFFHVFPSSRAHTRHIQKGSHNAHSRTHKHTMLTHAHMHKHVRERNRISHTCLKGPEDPILLPSTLFH